MNRKFTAYSLLLEREAVNYLKFAVARKPNFFLIAILSLEISFIQFFIKQTKKFNIIIQVMFHFISVSATGKCGFSGSAGNPHNLCSCSNTLHHGCGPQKPSKCWLNCPESQQFHFSPPENMRNKTDQTLVEWPKDRSHHFTTAIQRRKFINWRKKKSFASVGGSQDFAILLHCWSYSQKALVSAVVRWKGPTGLQTNTCLKPITRSSKLSKVS